MVTRRAVLVGAGAVLFARALAAQDTAEQTMAVLQQDLPDLALHDWAATVVEVTYRPGGRSASHSHPGITIAYVLEGSIRSKVGEQPERTYTRGQAFVEMPGQVHAVSRNASETEPARLLAVLLAEKGKALTTVVPK
jgi:quercetin dioxygenase-like cupin family protein